MILSALLVVSIVAVAAFALAAVLFGPVLKTKQPLIAVAVFGVFAGLGCLLGAVGGALALPLVSDASPVNLPLTALPTALAFGAVAAWVFLSRQARPAPSEA